jgi:hypothetical protein
MRQTLVRSVWVCSWVAALGLAVSREALATNSLAELRQVQADLLAWWPGEYDTTPQFDLEQRLGAPPDGEHDRQYRVFKRVAVPHIGEHVIYGEVRTGGKNGEIIPGQQVLYIISIDEQRAAVNVSGRRILNGPAFRLQDHTPEKLRSIAIDPNVGGNCRFLWRRQGSQLVAHLSDLDADTRSCTMVSKTSGQKMTWDAEWVLTSDELWVFDNGYLHDRENPARAPRLFAGRADMTFERMYKGKPYQCSLRGAKGASVSFELLDHGGEFPVGKLADEPLVLQLLRAPYPRANGVGLEDKLRLAFLPEGSDAPLTAQLSAASVKAIRAQHQDLQANCQSTHSGSRP